MKLLLLLPALALTLAVHATPAQAQATAPPGGDYKKVSELVALPDFLPGLGTLYVKPSTLPAGPFLAYDRDGRLVSSVYMIPLKDMEAQKGFDDLVAGPGEGGPRGHDVLQRRPPRGEQKPHYHVVLWYVPPDKAAA